MKDGSRSSVRRRIEIATFLLVFAWLLVVAATRVAALAAPGELRLDASGEKRFLGWAYRDPRVIASLSKLAPRLERGEAVFVTCSPGCEPGWIWVMAAYGLPAQAVVGAGTPRGSVGPTRLDWSRAGFRIVPRPGADGDP